jgi:hypothetical protein
MNFVVAVFFQIKSRIAVVRSRGRGLENSCEPSSAPRFGMRSAVPVIEDACRAQLEQLSDFEKTAQVCLFSRRCGSVLSSRLVQIGLKHLVSWLGKGGFVSSAHANKKSLWGKNTVRTFLSSGKSRSKTGRCKLSLKFPFN